MKMQMGKLRQSWKGDAGWVLGRSRGGLDRGVPSVIGDSEGRLKTRPWVAWEEVQDDGLLAY